MNSFEQLIDDHPEFDGLLERQVSYDMPLWLSQEIDSEPIKIAVNEPQPLDFDSL